MMFGNYSSSLCVRKVMAAVSRWPVYFVLTCAVLVSSVVRADSLNELRIAGWGGTDKAIIHSLVTDVLATRLAEQGIDINYLPIESSFNQFLMNALSSGTAPEVFYVDISMIHVLANSGKLQPYSKADQVKGEILPALAEAFTVDGVFYALPKDFNAYAVAYNKDVFDDAGVEYPNDQETYDSLFAKLRRVVDELGDEGVSGFCVNPGFTGGFAPILLSTGWKPLDDDYKTVIDSRFEAAFRDYIALFKEGIAIQASEIGHSWSGGCFGAERTAIAIEGNWLSGYLRDKAPNLVYGAVPIPVNATSGEAGNLLLTVGWGVNADGGDVAAAELVVELLSSESAQEWILGSGLALPSRTSMAQLFEGDDLTQEEQLTQSIYRGVQRGYVRPYNFGPYGDAWADPINEAISAVLVGGVSIEKALETTQSRYDYMYEKLGGRAK